MARLLTRSDILGEWHPLDGVPAPEVIPECWTSWHVGLRLSQAFSTLRRIPMAGGPREFGRAWPQYRIEWEDLLAQEETAREAAKIRERERNRVREMPSSEEVSRMEQAIVWPARYVQHEGHRNAVQKMALALSVERDASWVVRKFGGFIDTWINWDRLGRAVIAVGLDADNVPVF